MNMANGVREYRVGQQNEYREICGEVAASLGFPGKVLCIERGRVRPVGTLYARNTNAWLVPGVKEGEHPDKNPRIRVIEALPLTDASMKKLVEDYLKVLDNVPVIF